MLTTYVSKNTFSIHFLSISKTNSIKKSCDHLCLLGLLCGHLLPGYLHGHHVDRHHLPLAMYACNDIGDDLRSDPEENQKLLIEIIFIWLCHKSLQSLVFLSKFQNAHKVTKRGRRSAMVTTYISISQHPDMGRGFSGMDWFTKNQMKSQ